MYYCIPYIVIFSDGVSGIELALYTVECFNESLNYSVLGGCGVCFMVAVGCSMFCKDALVFDFSKGYLF